KFDTELLRCRLTIRDKRFKTPLLNSFDGTSIQRRIKWLGHFDAFDHSLGIDGGRQTDRAFNLVLASILRVFRLDPVIYLGSRLGPNSLLWSWRFHRHVEAHAKCRGSHTWQRQKQRSGDQK